MPDRLLARLTRNRSGLAMTEFALMMPIFVTMCIGGTELANYITTRMRISQVALQVADNAARMGNGGALAPKNVNENDVNDLFAGAQLEAGTLNLQANSRIILSDLEPMENTDANARYRINWQRCYGAKVHPSTYGKKGDVDMPGMGPTTPGSTQARAPKDGATMFVELYYVYKPLITRRFVPSLDIVEVASMVVRDRRNLSNDASAGTAALRPEGIDKVAGVTPATCS